MTGGRQQKEERLELFLESCTWDFSHSGCPGPPGCRSVGGQSDSWRRDRQDSCHVRDWRSRGREWQRGRAYVCSWRPWHNERRGACWQDGSGQQQPRCHAVSVHPRAVLASLAQHGPPCSFTFLHFSLHSHARLVPYPLLVSTFLPVMMLLISASPTLGSSVALIQFTTGFERQGCPCCTV